MKSVRILTSAMKRHETEEVTQLLLVEFALGRSVEIRLIEWACDQLASGGDSPHLRLLAGYNAKHLDTELASFRSDVVATISELRLRIPEVKEAYLWLACFHCRQYLSGKESADVALSSLYDIWRETAYEPELRVEGCFDVWMYLVDSVETVENGDGAVLDRFESVIRENLDRFLKAEAEAFLKRHQGGLEK